MLTCFHAQVKEKKQTVQRPWGNLKRPNTRRRLWVHFSVFCVALKILSCVYIWRDCLCLQSLPRIDLDNYSALPFDEGDEDRDARIGDEEDEGSDLDIGDDPSNEGKLLQINSSSHAVAWWVKHSYKFCCAVFHHCRGEGRSIHSSLCPPTLLSVGPWAAGKGQLTSTSHDARGDVGLILAWVPLLRRCLNLPLLELVCVSSLPTWRRHPWPYLASSTWWTVVGWRSVSMTEWQECHPSKSRGPHRPLPIRGLVEQDEQSQDTATGPHLNLCHNLIKVFLAWRQYSQMCVYCVCVCAGCTRPQCLETSVRSQRQRSLAGLWRTWFYRWRTST